MPFVNTQRLRQTFFSPSDFILDEQKRLNELEHDIETTTDEQEAELKIEIIKHILNTADLRKKLKQTEYELSKYIKKK